MQPIIAFISDFGLDDTWVGVCHAVVYTKCPRAHIVDLAHQIPPYDIWKAAVTAAAGVFQLPDAIHLVVVDPGVGEGRRDLCLVTANGTRLVGPDNGVLMPAALRAGGVAEAYELEPRPLGGKKPLPTFHARDVLAPAAAELACGVPPSELGAAVQAASLARAPFEPSRVEGDYTLAQVLESDRFGSIRTSITAEDVASRDLAGKTLEISIGHVNLSVPLGLSFSDVPEHDLVALVDSSGWLTLAENTGSAFERLGVEPGTVVRLRVRP
jgi:S-adenosylmethionine hydrolase